jgi:M6 family metalloprotease-like protein
LNGDEFDNFYTDLQGFTCLEDDDGDWVYAIQGPQGKLISTGVKCTSEDTLRPPGLTKKGIRPSAEARAADCVGKLCGDIRSHGRNDNSFRRLGGTRHRHLTPTTGTVTNLVVLIRFADHTGRTLPSQSDIFTLMNSPNCASSLCPTGSVRDVFSANSYDQLDLQSTVAPWVTVSQTEADYANGYSGLTIKTHELIREALALVDPLIDFSVFDNDGDLRIDSIVFLHSGYGAEWGGTDAYGHTNVDRMWSHKWAIYTNPGQFVSAEGVTVYDYSISPAVWGTSGSSIGHIGVIAHELGHFFGLPGERRGSSSFRVRPPCSLVSETAEPQHALTHCVSLCLFQICMMAVGVPALGATA